MPHLLNQRIGGSTDAASVVSPKAPVGLCNGTSALKRSIRFPSSISLVMLLALSGLLIACDPLAPEPTPVVIVVTATPQITVAAPTQAPPTQPPTVGPPPVATSAATDSAASILPEPNQPTCTETRGQVVDLSLESKAAKDTIKYRVYLPPCYYDSVRRYPYVILMPGSDKNQTEWTDLLQANEALDAGIALKALPPMILVMTQAGDLMNLNVFTDGASWESLILDELIPEVEKSFCTWNAREGRAIGGISRGGFWAFEIGFRHPDLFVAVGGHSPFFDLQNAPPDNNPMSLAKTTQFPAGMQPRIWMDVARDDNIRPNVEIVQKTLASRNIDPGYTMNPSGGHEVPYWAAHVAEYLGFYGLNWPRDVTELPSCFQ